MSDEVGTISIPVDGLLAADARRAHIPVSDLASMRLALFRALLPAEAPSPLRDVIRVILRAHSIDPGQIELVLDEIERLGCEPGPTRLDLGEYQRSLEEFRRTRSVEAAKEVLRRYGVQLGVGAASVALPQGVGTGASGPPTPARRPSIRGKYAHLNLSSEDFAREKRAEIEREERIAR